MQPHRHHVNPFTLLKRHFRPRDTMVLKILSAILLSDHFETAMGMRTQAGDITRLLAGWREGDRSALDRLLPLVRTELDRVARRHIGREGHHSMQPSSLVQEAFVRLLPSRDVSWQNRAHFFAVASQVMRHVLVDHARERLRQKRGGGAVHIPIDAAVVLSSQQVEEIVAVDLALQRLAATDERKSRVFEMRFFGGLTVEEVAEVLRVAPNTVIRDWNFARAWLRRELGAERADSGPVAPD
ncbi:MAG TPA: ECF-type sigma factor [Vicinamibacterales bacterium]|nr:ECF-type sigma factor [Vicinamibacterales bacterium]